MIGSQLFKHPILKKISWVSFDCWETILRANPEYRPQRNKLLHEIVFPESNLSDEDFSLIVKKAKNAADTINESLGEQLSSRQSMMLINVFFIPEIPKEKVSSRLEEYEAKHNKIFDDAMPLVYSDETIETLEELKRLGIGMNISCNTSFINGATLDRAFKARNLRQYFSFNLYSDEIGCSKPNPSFYNRLQKLIGVDKESIMHVGDNTFSDGGSKNAGIEFLHINGSSGNSISEILKHV